MKAKATTLTVLFVMGTVAFSVTQAQSNSNTNTATISRGGAISSQNPSSWISAVRIQSSGSFGAGTVYQIIFSGNAPSASSCTATPTTSDLTGLVTSPAATPGQLLVSFQQSGSSGGQITPMASAFTLSCAAS
jgi:Tfp pilus assembly protein PilV